MLCKLVHTEFICSNIGRDLAQVDKDEKLYQTNPRIGNYKNNINDIPMANVLLM